MIDEKILQEAIDTWGIDVQIEMIIEESSELILALQKLKRNYGNDISKKKEALKNVYSEIADVKIMIAQAELIFDKKEINSEIKFKMNRLIDRLKINKKYENNKNRKK